MKKTAIIFSFHCISTALLFAQPSWQWAQDGGSKQIESGFNDDRGKRMAVDRERNVYVVGTFATDSIRFGNFMLHNAGYVNVFLVKYSPSGNVIWARSLEGSSQVFDDYAGGITIDPNDHVYITGNFRDTIRNVGSPPIVSSGFSDIFIVKYDKHGNVLAHMIAGGSDHNDFAEGIATDYAGNVYVTGSFYGNTINFGSVSLKEVGSSNYYLVKYNSSGNAVWAKTSNTLSAHIFMTGTSVAADPEGNVLVSGYFTGSDANFSGIILENSGVEDVFIIKYNADGTIVWAKSAGGDGNDWPRSVKSDRHGNVLVAGTFSSTEFFADSVRLPLNRGATGSCFLCNDFFLLQYDAGGTLKWVRRSTSNIANEASANDLVVDKYDNCYIAGSYAGNIRVGSYSFNTSPASFGDVLLIKYDTKGQLNWAMSASGPDADNAFGLAAANDGAVYMTGNFRGSELILGMDTLVNQSKFYNYFLGRMNECSTSVELGNDILLGLGEELTIEAPVHFRSYCWSEGSTTNLLHIQPLNLPLGDKWVYLTVTDSNGCMGYDSLKITITPVGISEDFNQMTSHIYPIPFSDQLFFELDQAAAITIFSMQGVLVYEGILKEGRNVIETTSLRNGIYLLKETSGSRSVMRKIVKQ